MWTCEGGNEDRILYSSGKITKHLKDKNRKITKHLKDNNVVVEVMTLDLSTLKLSLVYTKRMPSTTSTNVSPMVTHAVVWELILNAMKIVHDHH